MKIKAIMGLTLASVMVLAALLSVSCSSGEENGDSAAIEDTIRGYVNTYNSEDFVQCLTYFTGYDDEEDALAFLSYMRNLSGEMELKKVKDVSVSTPTTATATVMFTMLGEDSTDQMQIRKVGGQWKILWEEESPFPTPTPEPTQYQGIRTEGCFPSTVEVAPALQGVVQVKHCLWAEGGDLYEAWSVQNTGDHVVVLSFKFYVYDADGQELLLEGISPTEVQPGSYMVDCNPCGAMAPPSTTHYRIVVSSS
jgi:uncharacterized protein YcfL